MDNAKKQTNMSDWLLPLLAVLLCIFILPILLGRRQTDLPELYPKEGILDIRDVDFSSQVYDVVNHWEYYPFRLYTDEDFAAGAAEKTPPAGSEVNNDEVPYGTYRLRILARPREMLTICGFSMDYATRVLVNGREVCNFGYVADSAEEAIPGGGYMTIPLDTGENGQVEILYQYSNFVHNEGGFIPVTYLSTPQNIEEFKEGNALASVGLGASMVILTLYFLLCAAVQKNRTYLSLAFLCGLIALRDNLFWGSYLLPLGASWQMTYRTSLSVVALLPMAFLLLLRRLYPVGKPWPHRLYLTAMGADLLMLISADSHACVRWSTAAYVLSALYLLYLLILYLRQVVMKRPRLRSGDFLALSGLGIFLGSLLTEALLTRRYSFVTRAGLTPMGMLVCVLLLAVSVGLRVQEQKAALAESRSRSEMLERMNTLNLDFLHKVAHELKTPLTVISGYAQLAQLQLSANQLSEETPENLKTIHQEALRLADLVARLMDYSYGVPQEVTFGTVEVGPLLDRVQAICTPMCLKNNNRVEIEGRDSPDIYGNQEMLLQVFINLAVNANRHTRNGVIRICASRQESHEFVVFRVQDTGSGIPAELQSELFEKGRSGDGSTGFGLSICREAVEVHGGAIWLEHTDENGTTFAFRILKRGIAQ